MCSKLVDTGVNVNNLASVRESNVVVIETSSEESFVTVIVKYSEYVSVPSSV